MTPKNKHLPEWVKKKKIWFCGMQAPEDQLFELLSIMFNL